MTTPADAGDAVELAAPQNVSGALPEVLRCYLQNGQQPVPATRVAADAAVAATAMRTVDSARILVFIE